MPYIQGSNDYRLFITIMPNCHEVRSSRLLQSFPRVQGLVLFNVFFMSSTSLTLLFHNETFIFNFAALTTPWGHIVCRGLYHLLASKSADLLPQLLLTINRKSQITLLPDFFTTQNVRPCLLFHIRTRLATTATKAQSILTGRSLIVLHIVHIIVVTCCQCCHLLSMLSPTCN